MGPIRYHNIPEYVVGQLLCISKLSRSGQLVQSSNGRLKLASTYSPTENKYGYVGPVEHVGDNHSKKLVVKLQ